MKELLPLLPRPSRYLGNEWGAARKAPEGLRASVALAFPDLYEVGMSYLGQKILAEAVNARPGLGAERVFAPCLEAAALLRERRAPLATLESDTPLARMDAVAFSLTHELCYTNVLYMLDLAGIPLRAGQRTDWSWPLVLAGGGACFNPEPVAEFLDLCVLGDGEEILPEILERLAAAREAGTSRADFLRSLAGLPGVYAPAHFAWEGPGKPVRPLLPGHGRVAKAILPDLAGAPFPAAPAVPFGQAVHDRYTLELARGCTRGCRFCHAGMVYRPVREKTPQKLGETLSRAVRATGFEEVSLLSLSTGDYSALESLFDTVFGRCAAEQVSISLPSLRVGSLSEGIMARIASIRHTGATLAPEAGSQRLRDVINKGVSEEALLEHIRTLMAHGWQQVKLYFMIGLPTETDADLDAIAELCVKARDAAGRHVKRLQITCSVSPFVPKTHTPFQWEAQISLEEIRRRVYRIKDALKPYKRISLKFHQPEMSFLEGVFSRGDRRLGPVLESAFRKGALFSSWKDHLALAPYLEALAEHGLEAGEFQAARDPDAPLPWDHLDCGVSKEFLLAERRRALEEKITEDCRYGACRNCGVCGHQGRSSRLSAPDEIRPRVVFSRRDQEEASPLSLPEVPPAAGVAEASPLLLPEVTSAAKADEASSRSFSEATLPAGVAEASPLLLPEVTSAAGADDGPCARESAAQTGEAEAPSGAPSGPSSAAPNTPSVPAEADTQDPQAPQAPQPPPPPQVDLHERQAQYRIWYEKLGEAAYLSQLELQSVLERALRRARLPLSFSAGFHPMPRISFGRALPVGVESLAEWFTLTLRENLEPAAVLASIAAQMPAGLAPVRIEALGLFERTAQPLRERFRLRLTGDAAEQARLQAAWAAFLASESYVVERKSKKGPKPTDLRRLVAEARPEGPDALALTLALTLDWTEEYMSPLALVLAIGAPVSPLQARLLKVGQEVGGAAGI